MEYGGPLKIGCHSKSYSIALNTKHGALCFMETKMHSNLLLMFL